MKIDPYQRLWMNKKRPIPGVVDEQKRSMTEVVDE
jgi:hypothetical protein